MAVDETFYIYDDFLNEIIATRDFTENNWFSFGSQEFDKLINLCVTLDKIIIFEQNSTIIFNTLGQLESNYNELFQVDKGQFFSLIGNSIKHKSSGRLFTPSTMFWQSFFINNNIVILIAENHLLIGKFIYEIS